MSVPHEIQALMRSMAQEAADEAVKRTLLTLGIDPDNPIQAQRDMATLRELRELVESEEFQKDLLHLRRWRKTMDGVERKGILAALGLMCVGGIAFILYAIKLKTGVAP